MKYCPTCRIKYLDSESVCPKHNTQLLPPLSDPYHLVGDETKNIIDGKYRLDWVVGKGGMAVIYCAHQISMDRTVILKMPLEELATDERYTNMFECEAKNAGKLYHENIVVIHDCGRTQIGTTNGIPYMVMEWLEGISLEQEISNGTPTTPPKTKPLELEETSHILRQIAAALQAAHEKNIIHRDIKPSNIMLIKDSSGHHHIKMVDFGISKVITGDKTHTYNTEGLGTPYYASPEQWQTGAEIDQTSDIYSLGIMLYQMITGRLPFYGPSIIEVIRKHSEEKPPKISAVRFEAIVVEKILLEMMDKSRKNRPKKVIEIADSFAKAIIPVDLKGQVVWDPGNTDKIESISKAIIKLRQIQIADQVTDKNGFFSFDRVINLHSFKVNVQADYFVSKDYEIEAEQSNLIWLTPKTADLSGRVFEQVAEGGSDIPLRKLSNVELRMKPIGQPIRSDLTTSTDNEGRFKISLVGPQIAYINTPYTIEIEGFQNASQFLTLSEMSIIVMPAVVMVGTPDKDNQVHCLRCGHKYAQNNLPKFCYGCGSKLLELVMVTMEDRERWKQT